MWIVLAWWAEDSKEPDVFGPYESYMSAHNAVAAAFIEGFADASVSLLASPKAIREIASEYFHNETEDN